MPFVVRQIALPPPITREIIVDIEFGVCGMSKCRRVRFARHLHATQNMSHSVAIVGRGREREQRDDLVRHVRRVLRKHTHDDNRETG